MLNAFARIGLRRPALAAQHLQDAAMEANLLQVEFTNRQPLWWTSEEITQVLTASDGEYDLSARVVTIIAAYISTTDDDSNVTDRIITPISTYDYAAMPNKLTPTGVPTVFKFETLSTPRITLWQVPDAAETYTLKLRVLCQPEDVLLPSGVNIDAPYRFLDAYTAGLAHRLARIYKPEMEQARMADYERAWNLAANQDVENVPMYIMPQIGYMFR